MFKELSRNVFHCSVIMVLCLATAFIAYHFRFRLSRTFLLFFVTRSLSETTLTSYHVILHLSRTFLFFLFSCLLFLGFPSTAISDYHIFFCLSTNNFIFFKKIFFRNNRFFLLAAVPFLLRSRQGPIPGAFSFTETDFSTEQRKRTTVRSVVRIISITTVFSFSRFC